MKKSIFLGVLSFLILGCTNAPKYSKTSYKQSIANIIDSLVSENNIPGLNFSIIYKSGKQQNYSSGYANMEKKIKMIGKYVMFSGSIGKTYAVAIIMQLVDEGKIDLENKIIDYFPENEWLKLLPNIEDITVQMLLEHSSGLSRYVLKPTVWDTLHNNPDKVWTYKDRLSHIFNDEPIHEAGKGWAYSDTNYILLGMLIEKITGNYYYDEVRSRLLVPYGLHFTFAADNRLIPNLPMAYSRLPEMFKMPEKVIENGRYVFNPQMEWTGGGMLSNTPDLAKWAKIYYADSLFSDELKAKIITPNANGQNTGKHESYGMGSFIYHTKQGDVYGHSGFVPGFNSIFAYYPKDSIAVALQVNCDYAKEKMTLVNYLENIMEEIIEND